jgi:hypothetical protein
MMVQHAQRLVRIGMLRRGLILLTGLGATLVFGATPASAQDVAICFGTADRVTEGAAVTQEEKQAGHEACQRALAETASVVQKYHLQEADFDMKGRPPKPDN